MSIPVTCPECQSHFHVGDEFAGQAGRCPDCTAVLQVPDPAVALHPDPEFSPYWSPRSPEPFEGLPPRARQRERRRDPEAELRADYDDRPRRPQFDPHDRAVRWARVHRGLGYLLGAVALGFLSQILQTLLFLARGGVRPNPDAGADSGQVAMAFGTLALLFGSWLFWVLGRAAGIRVPYVPARSCARASFTMVLGCIAAVLVTFCLLVGSIMAMAPGGAGGPEAALLGMMLMLALFLTIGLAFGAEIAGLVALGRIGDALKDRGAAGWARRSIVVMLLAGGVMAFGVCGVSIYWMAKQQPKQAQAKAARNQPAAAKDKQNGENKGKEKVQAKEPDKDRPAGANADDKKKGDLPDDGPAEDPPPEPLDGPATLFFNLVCFGPMIFFLIHYSIALHLGRRAIRREIDVLTGRDHGGHDHPY